MSNPALDKLREITARNVANGGAIYGITAEDVMRETRAALDDSGALVREGWTAWTATAATIYYLRRCQTARAAGHPVSLVTDPAWLVEQVINRRAGWLQDEHARGTTKPIGDRFPRKARGDYLRHLGQIARELNTPRLIVRVSRLGEHRWLVARLPQRFEGANDD